ncbi:MAG: Hpt domain-containing protein [Chloroflexi bacterium]|uniref:Hpt domain-containing protein n=1 Tax=Candidatus Chlorohelix allophototropha TaxID=3003348 RepID=A0A8T7M6G8_9CHLR|nr:Hpt domain-containing protein [Chloroflexota bacterium]WJW69482.1 Hpt domain-containing protein [Chloroflexota bacterium L227-S17]
MDENKLNVNAAVTDSSNTNMDFTMLSNLLKLADGSEEFVLSIVELYLEDTAKLLKEIDHNLIEHDAKALKFNIHTIKGSSGNVGALAVIAQCTEIENQLSAGDLTGIEPICNRLKLEFERVKDVLEVNNLMPILGYLQSFG